MEKIVAGQLVPKISKIIPLEKIRDAQRLLETTKVGRVVLRVT
jgi:NADPH:quinone reductase-like Zn-dependent oxidoreductase